MLVGVGTVSGNCTAEQAARNSLDLLALAGRPEVPVAIGAHDWLGGDYDGVHVLPVGMEDVTGYPLLFAELLERGWSEEDLAGLACRNALRVLRAADAVAARS